MKIGSLFSGIGGLEMGLEMCGLGPVAWQCDSDPYARAVLAAHWPNVKRYEDVREIDGSAERVDVICGGFPCQDISNAGKRVGITGERSGLWFEYARIIRDLRPRIVFVENVAALANRGLDAVLGSLAELGYDAEWDVFSAAETGAPHLRKRMFILAHPHRSPGRPAGNAFAGVSGEAISRGTAEPGRRGSDVAHANGAGLAIGKKQSPREELQAPERSSHALPDADSSARGRAAEPWGERGNWSVEPNVGRVAHGIPARAHRLRLLGNACVPQQAALAYQSLAARIAHG